MNMKEFLKSRCINEKDYYEDGIQYLQSSIEYLTQHIAKMENIPIVDLGKSLIAEKEELLQEWFNREIESRSEYERLFQEIESWDAPDLLIEIKKSALNTISEILSDNESDVFLKELTSINQQKPQNYAKTHIQEVKKELSELQDELNKIIYYHDNLQKMHDLIEELP